LFYTNDIEQNKSAIGLFEDASLDWGELKQTYLQLKTRNFKGLSQWHSYQLQNALDTFKVIIDNLNSIQNDSKMFKYLNAQILNNIGLINWELKKGIIAKDYYIKSLNQYGVLIDESLNTQKIASYIKSTPYYYDISTTLNNLALINKNLGYPTRAQKIWNIVLELTDNDIGRLLNAQSKTNLATILIDKGEYDEARVLINEAIDTFKLLNNRKWLYISQYQSSQLNLKLGMINLAEIQFKKNSQMRSIKNNPKDIVELNLKLMEIYRIQGKYNQSIQLGNDTLELANTIKHQKSKVKIHQNNFIINKARNNLEAARSELSLAFNSINGKTLKKLESELNIHNAEINILQNKPTQAIHILQSEALKLKNIWDTQLLNKTNNLLAQAYIKINDHNKAFEIISNEIINLQFYINSSKNNKIQFGLNNMLRESLNIFSIITQYLDKTEIGFIKTNEMQNRFSTKILKNTSIVPSNIDLISTLREKSVALENMALSEDDRKLIQNDMVELKAKIDFSYTAQTPQEQSKLSFKTIQDSIDEETLVIQYSIGEAGGISWWIAKGKVETHEVANKNELIQLIKLAHDEFIQKSRGDKNIQRLSHKLLLPLKAFKNVSKIYLVLDEPLNLIPFNALLDPRHENKKVLAESTKTQRFASIQFLKSIDNKQAFDSSKISSLIIADPVTSADDDRLPVRLKITEEYSHSFTRLLGSKSEAKNISQFLKSGTINGFKANKEELLSSNFRNKSILHFATHAFFHPEISGLSSIVLSTYNEKGENNPSAYLRALEISNLELNADLVVLSGCETGVNKYDDSLGLGGLTESFMQAGSKNLIASLWKVDDQITNKMMTEFYRGYTNGLTISDALNSAQKLIRDNPRTRHPKYWAGWFLLSN
jgi:CHAT domain-containing protein